MEEICLDTSSPAAAPTAFYSNKTLSTPLSPPLVLPHQPGKNNGNNNNRHRNNNRRNSGSGGKNSDNGGNRGGNTTMVSHYVTTNDGRGPLPWPTFVNPSQGHIAMYPGPSPTCQQWSQAFMAMMGPYTLPCFVPRPQ
jgi:hypothetical protein